MEPNNPDEETLDFYVSLSCAAISRQQYKDALRVIKKGLESSIGSEKRSDIRKLITSFYGLVAILNSKLEEAYGENWEEKIEI
jgi:hypothetical protein